MTADKTLKIEVQPNGITAHYAGESVQLHHASRDESLALLVKLTGLSRAEIRRTLFDAAAAFDRKFRANTLWYNRYVIEPQTPFKTVTEALIDDGFSDGLVYDPAEFTSACLALWLSGATEHDLKAAQDARPTPGTITSAALSEWCGPVPEVVAHGVAGG